ncbi:MAG: serine/threonine protein kinase [Polyangiaceae bacterium]|nr:serine/threonine protein kinase [Polyangiaceae bacterium]
MIAPGSLIAQRFLVERTIGSGGMGVVLQVRHQGLNERFAIKVLRPRAGDPLRAAQRFQREARAAASLRCEHTVRVVDFGHLEDGSPFFVMELVEGQSLAARLQSGPLPVAEAIQHTLHVCAALAEAHALGIVHRDIKPANLLLTTRSDGSPLVKLADFGVAKLQEVGLLTDTHASLGSPAYMSPEQIRSAREVDPRTDLWSVGVTLYELLSGRLPFHAFTAPGVLSRVLTEEPTPLASLCPGLPPPLLDIVARCLQKDPARRHESVLDLADALARIGPDPGEGDRIRRIAAHAVRPPPAPAPLPTTPPEQITEVATALTQEPDPAPAPAPRPRPPPLLAARRFLWLAALPGAFLAGKFWLSSAPSSPDPTHPSASSVGSTRLPPPSASPALSAPPQAPPALTATAAPASTALLSPSPSPAPSARTPPRPPRAAPRASGAASPLGEFGSRQ